MYGNKINGISRLNLFYDISDLYAYIITIYIYQFILLLVNSLLIIWYL